MQPTAAQAVAKCSSPTLAHIQLAGYFPAVWAAALTFGGPHQKFLVSALMLLNPAQVLIDHGHFQYNSISLGLAVSLHSMGCHPAQPYALPSSQTELLLVLGAEVTAPCINPEYIPVVACRQEQRQPFAEGITFWAASYIVSL